MIEVVAAFFRSGNTFMICQRPVGKSNALGWEFPGGKIEPGESAARALARECMEELSVLPVVSETPIADVTHDYGSFSIHLSLHSCILPEGTQIQLLEHADCRWITPDRIAEFEFCPADLKLLKKLFPTKIK